MPESNNTLKHPEIDDGYGFQEEMEVESDHIQKGTFRFIVAILVIIVAVVQLTLEWTQVVGVEARDANGEWAGPPAILQTRTHAARLLSQYEVTDKEAGTYRIPIERAMELEVEEARAD